ncbi:MAG: hypothetical protein IKX62_01165 [Bacteroidales bacterium]|nr:hypothetical protein [Bacteroidales bacterium]
MEWLIPLLMFAFPVAIALLDKRAKKRKGVPQVQSRPIFPPAQRFPETRASAPDRASDYPAIPLEGAQGVKDSKRSDWSAEGGTVSHGRLPDPTALTQATRVSQTYVVSGDELPSRNQQEEEGQRAISKERRKATETKKVNPGQKLEIDKKKLIIYSEILKPKFDA